MLHTRLVDVLGIEHPIIQAGMGTFGSGATLAAAVSRAGAMGTIGAAKRSADGLTEELRAFRELTDAPFSVNFRLPWLRLYPECLDVALAARPRAISMSAGLPGELTRRIHDQGALVIAQVQSPEQASLAADEGVDIIIALGAEAGGYGASIGSLVLIPQVVDAVAPLPVVAAGGISGPSTEQRSLGRDQQSASGRDVPDQCDDLTRRADPVDGPAPAPQTVGGTGLSGKSCLNCLAYWRLPTRRHSTFTESGMAA
jgi:NAD(P)H-dependent flavin oxidoreductase YrpB (nitropropane dioxygenase family)